MEEYSKLTLTYYIKKLKSFNKNMKSAIEQIPDYIIQLFLKLSIEDSRKFIEQYKLDPKLEKELSFLLYKAYMAGSFVEKVRNEEKNDDLSEKKNNVIHIKVQ